MNLITRNTCRICGSGCLSEVLSLGPQYLSSTFIQPDGSNFIQRQIPLELVRCSPELDEKACGLIQLRHTVPPELMYASYWYQSGINRTMTENLVGIANQAEKLVGLKSGDLVLDIGCNDGTLLAGYQTKGIQRVGFEPAQNIVKIARDKKLDVINGFFSSRQFQQRHPNSKAKVITTIAMFYDLENPHEFVEDLASILDEDGVWIGELAYFPTMIERNAFDVICHEHLEYFHLGPMEYLLARYGLRIVDVELNEINGGSFRFVAKHAQHPFLSASAQSRVAGLKKKEFELAFDTEAPYQAFKKNCERIKVELNSLVNRAISQQKTIFLYGASTKGNTILQYCGIGNDRIIAAADRNPVKHGLKTPGTNITIISEEEARRQRPDYMLILPWHFLDEFVHREAEYLNGGGKFICPLPEVRVLDGSILEKWKKVA